MFKSRKSIGKAISRTAAALVLGSIALTSTATSASAQTVAGDGVIRLGVDCYLATNRADAWVAVQTPSRFSSTGLVYYLRIWAIGQYDRNWTQLGTDIQTGVVNTYTQVGSVLMNNPLWIAKRSFTGTDGNYDVYVQYWYRTPSATTWSGMYGFSLTGDPHSLATIYSNNYGTLGSDSKICSL